MNNEEIKAKIKASLNISSRVAEALNPKKELETTEDFPPGEIHEEPDIMSESLDKPEETPIELPEETI